MKTVSGKEFCKLLERNGWALRRVTGSHHIYAQQGRKARVSVPVHGNTTLKLGLLKHLLEIAGLSENDI